MTYYNDLAPHEADLPAPWNSRLNDFQKMIVLRCLRPDKVQLYYVASLLHFHQSHGCCKFLTSLVYCRTDNFKAAFVTNMLLAGVLMTGVLLTGDTCSD